LKICLNEILDPARLPTGWVDFSPCHGLVQPTTTRKGNELPTARFLKNINNGHILGAAALLAPSLEIVSWPSITPVMVIAALFILLFGKRPWPLRPRWLVVLSALLAGLAAASATWSLNPAGSLKLASWLLGTFSAGLVLLGAALGLAQEERETVENRVVLGFVCGLLLLEFMLLTDGRVIEYVRNLSFLEPIFGKQRPVRAPVEFDTAISFVTLLIWPVTGILLRRRGVLAAITVYALGLLVVLQGVSGAAKIAYVLSILVFFVGRLAPRTAAWALGAAIACGIVAAPVLLQLDYIGGIASDVPFLKNKAASVSHRLAIWSFTAQRIDERPLLGWGIDSSRWMPGGHDHHQTGGELLPLHPHDAALQLRLDLGVPGVLLGACFAIFVAAGIARRNLNPASNGVALAFIAAASVFAMVSFNLWHIWWLTMLWITSVFTVVAVYHDRNPTDRIDNGAC